MRNKLFLKITRTLRGRLSLWYLATVGFIVFVLLFAMSGLFWFTIQEQIDHHVHIAANEAHQIVQNYRGEERNNLIKNLVSAKGMTVIVLSPDGSPLLETNSPDVALVTEHQLQKLLVSRALFETSPMHFTESNIRFAALPVQVNAGKGLVAVGYSTQVLYSTFYKVLGIVSGVIIFLVIPITFLFHRLLKKQLLPLENISKQAKLVTNTLELSKRIRIAAETEELDSIQNAFNFMLMRLENIFKREREFFSDSAHTLKTPLAVLRAQIENISIAKTTREGMLSTIDSVNDTIQDLLFLSSIGGKNKNISTFSLSDLMTDLVELATTLGENNQLSVTSNIARSINFKGDKNLFQRALSNIIYNAVIYNRPNGTIDIDLKKRLGKIAIVVRDSGLGISKKDQQNLFKRFFRASNTTGKGSGLGLAIAKSVIENTGGEILISSILSKETTITIKL